jgi:sugar-specific transcriptional regulator TrmB
MNSTHRAKLEQLGLSPLEAHVYLAILHHGPLAAAAIASETRIPRTSIYPIVCSLADKGLVEGGAGYGSKFAAVGPDEALPALVAREKQRISEREEIAEELAETLAPLAADTDTALDDTVQVVRTPQVISERFQRLQLETARLSESFIKAPILSFPNPAQKKARRRGVQYRALYERAVIEDPRITPYLEDWLSGGEEVRVYDGELPYKLVLCDREVVLLTLVRRSGQPSAMVVRHAPFAKSIGVLFDYFWQQAKPFDLEQRQTAPTRNGSPGHVGPNRDHALPRLRRKAARSPSTRK